MERQKKIIDASVLVKWFLNEEYSEPARELKDKLIKRDLILIAPELIFLEVSNALCYKKLDKNLLVEVNKTLWDIGIKIERINKEIMIKAIENSLKYNITIYDALYVTIAQIYNTFLITADTELYKIPNVIPLEKI